MHSSLLDAIILVFIGQVANVINHHFTAKYDRELQKKQIALLTEIRDELKAEG